jgi:hypothetical protein
LTCYADLVRWAGDARVLSAREVKRLLERARRHPAEADAVFQAARST